MSDDSPTTVRLSSLARRALFAMPVLGVGVVELLVLSRYSWVFQHLQGWFYLPTARTIGPASAWAVLLVAALATFFAINCSAAPRWRVALLVAAGVGMLVGFAMIENRGLFAIRDRVLNAGHSEFARTAASGISFHDVATRYESLVSSGQFGPFERSKPPGTLLFYLLTERIGHSLLPFTSDHERLDWLATFATFTWPVVSMLSLVPLFFIGCMIADAECALSACALSIAAPSFLLITMHTDQVLFPGIINGTLACATLAARQSSVKLGFCAGMLGYLAVFCSFGLMGAAPVLLACVVLGAATRSTHRVRVWLTALRVYCAIGIGIVTSGIIARVVLGYHVFHRYDVAISGHLAWKLWAGTKYEVWHFAWLNTLEFVVWVGTPIALLVLVGAVLGLVELARTRSPNDVLLATAVTATVVLLAWFGRTKAESARLWLFLVQPMCLAASITLHRMFPKHSRLALAGVWITQFAIVLEIKRFQDFY
jgi:hypothetical protein